MAATGVDAKTASDTANEDRAGQANQDPSASDDATRLHNMAMAHTTHIYLLNKEGQVVRYIYPSLTPEQLAKRLTDLVNERLTAVRIASEEIAIAPHCLTQIVALHAATSRNRRWGPPPSGGGGKPVAQRANTLEQL